MSKPIIAITSRCEDGYIWQRNNYMDCIEAAGGIAVCLSLHGGSSAIDSLVDRFDGFLFSGGDDIHPGAYGEDMLEECKVDTCRDALEIPLMAAVLAKKKPVFGICRGLQVMNIVLGGNLYQDIPSQLPESNILHNQEEPFTKTVHQVNILPNTPLTSILGSDRIDINSMHHQSIRALAESLRPTAMADDNIIEGVYLPDHPFAVAVQWHPEWLGMEDPASAKLFVAFIDACN